MFVVKIAQLNSYFFLTMSINYDMKRSRIISVLKMRIKLFLGNLKHKTEFQRETESQYDGVSLLNF